MRLGWTIVIFSQFLLLYFTQLNCEGAPDLTEAALSEESNVVPVLEASQLNLIVVIALDSI